MQIAEQLNTALADRYVIKREIGRGGTAIVYLAHDVRHDRSVALKVLNPELGEILGATRFLAEIRVTANLQHPNLLPLFDSGEADGLLFYVMPYVEDQSLRSRLTREKQLPIDAAVHVAASVAAALEYAHAHGVIHRDLKPENILLQAGQPVVADFGIALTVSKAAGTRITQDGISLGTPQYMSPEQATGDRVVDPRSDVYSLAAVLYEMLTGDAPHTGNSAQAIIAKLLTEDVPSVRLRRPNVPAHVADAIAVGLEKLPADRWASAQAFADAITSRPPVVAPAGGSFAFPRWTDFVLRRRALLFATLFGVASVAAGVVIAASPRSREQVQPSWFDLALPDSAAPIAMFGKSIAISPDGSIVAYIGGSTQTLFVRPLSELSPRRLAGTEGAVCPSFSPDGRWIVFTALGRLKKVPIRGGAPITIADSAGLCAVWTDQNEIVFDLASQLVRMSANGGPVAVLARFDTSKRIGNMIPSQALPGGRSVLINISDGVGFYPQIGLVSLPDGHVTKLTPNDGVQRFRAQYTSGFIAFAQADPRILARPFSLRTRRFTGPAMTLLEATTEFATANGSLAYHSETGPSRSLVAVRRGGGTRLLSPSAGDSAQQSFAVGVQSPLENPSRARAEVLSGVASLSAVTLLDAAYYGWPRLSPDGKRVAMELATGGTVRIWVYDIDSRTLTRLTHGYSGVRPSGWTADGREVVFLASDSASTDAVRGSASRCAETNLGGSCRLVAQPWDGSAPPRELMRLPQNVHAVSVSSLRGYAVFEVVHPGKPWDIWIAPLDTPRAARLLVAAPVAQPRLSPDGKLLAYAGVETGRPEVYVRSVVGAARRLLVSAGGGHQPVWSADGPFLYYRGPEYMMRATITAGPELRVARRDTLFRDVFSSPDMSTAYDVFPGGKELLMIREGPVRIRSAVILNWPELLRQRAARR